MSKPIRILHILQRMEAGGTQALLMNIYRNIDRSKVQFDFLVEYDKKQFYDDEIISLGGKIYYTNVRKDFNIFKFEKILKKIIKENDYKIVHVHAFTIGYFCLKTAKKCGVPVRIAHSHSNAMVKNKKIFIKNFLKKIYTIYANELFACSEEAGKFFYGEKAFKVIKNGIDTDKFSQKIQKRDILRKEFNLDDKIVIGHVGRFKPEKNHDFLLDVYNVIRKKNNNTKLLLVGSGDLENQILKKIEILGMKNDVIILQNRTDMENIYQLMDVFVFPSLYEGLGIVAIEAQASGIPLVCSDTIPNETVLTPLYNKLSLKDNLEKWAENILLSISNKNAHKNFKKEIINAGYDILFSTKYLQEYYLNMYKKCNCIKKKI